MKKKFPVKPVIALIIVSISMVFFINTLKAQGRSNKQYSIVTVEEGDTLWSIAKKNCKNCKDIRKAIYYIEKVNNIDSASITPGQRIKLPAEFN